MKAGSAQRNEMNVIIHRNNRGDTATSPDAKNDFTPSGGVSQEYWMMGAVGGGKPDSSELSEARIHRLREVIRSMVKGLLTARLKGRIPAVFGGASAGPVLPRNEVKAV
jgi:hypothetical protein